MICGGGTGLTPEEATEWSDQISLPQVVSLRLPHSCASSWYCLLFPLAILTVPSVPHRDCNDIFLMTDVEHLALFLLNLSISIVELSGSSVVIWESFGYSACVSVNIHTLRVFFLFTTSCSLSRHCLLTAAKVFNFSYYN